MVNNNEKTTEELLAELKEKQEQKKNKEKQTLEETGELVEQLNVTYLTEDGKLLLKD